jgi:hypothetical protein
MTGGPIDTMTVLTTRGPLATKITWVPGENAPRVQTYGRAKNFSILERPLSGPDDLVEVLRCLEHQPRRLIVRGKPKDGVDRNMAPRLFRNRRNSDGSITPATLEPYPHHWIALDCDRIPCPDALNPLFEPDWAAEHVVSALPVEFHGATCWWQFTASQAIESGISLRWPTRHRKTAVLGTCSDASGPNFRSFGGSPGSRVAAATPRAFNRAIVAAPGSGARCAPMTPGVTAAELRQADRAVCDLRPDVDRPKMRLVSWSPPVKGNLRGFATVELSNGLRVINCPALERQGKFWAILPGKPQIDQDGSQKRGATASSQIARSSSGVRRICEAHSPIAS